MEITSRYDGVVKKVHYKVGEMAQVGSTLIDIEVDEAIAATVHDSKAAASPAKPIAKASSPVKPKPVAAAVAPPKPAASPVRAAPIAQPQTRGGALHEKVRPCRVANECCDLQLIRLFPTRCHRF